MGKNKLMILALSVLSILTLGLGIVAFGRSEWFPPGGSVVP